jgi:HD-like signal output (HDOD) protein
LEDRTYGLDAWLQRLSDAELPALASVARNLQQLADQHDHVTVQQMAGVLLHDPALTSKVLRIANSTYYNPTQEPIRTLTRAIVLIGFENVRQIALSVGLIDTLLNKSTREQLVHLLAQSFHAAVQARNIAGYLLSRHQEEVFIAALLYHLGELAFWGCGGEQADALADALSEAGAEPEPVARQLLGLSFRQLSVALARSWGLGDGTSAALNASGQGEMAARAVQLGVRISEIAPEGWDSEGMQKLIKEVAQFTGITTEDAFRQVLSSADEAVDVARTYGASKLCELIPSTDPEQIRAQQEARRARLLQPDLALLQHGLQELGLLATLHPDINLVLDTLMKGLHQGAGLERIMVALLADNQTTFRARRVIGEKTDEWSQEFVIPAGLQNPTHIFGYSLRNRETLWMGVPATLGLQDLVTTNLRTCLGNGMFFIAPLSAGKRDIGVIYADNRVSGRALKNEQFIAFQRYAQATCRCLDMMGRR